MLLLENGGERMNIHYISKKKWNGRIFIFILLDFLLDFCPHYNVFSLFRQILQERS